MLHMSLAYRIATMPHMMAMAHPALTVDHDSVRKRVAMEAGLIRKAVKLSLDNVADWFARHERPIWYICEDVPNIAPPWPLAFAEWTEPREWYIDGQWQRNDQPSQIGVLAATIPAPAEGAWDLEHVANICHGASGGLAMPDIANLEIFLPQTRWLYLLSTWMASPGKPCLGHPLWDGVGLVLLVNARGKCLMTGGGGIADVDSARVWTAVHIWGLGISFSHCKNVVTTVSRNDRGRKWHERTRSPVFTYHTLNINPMREVLRCEGQSDTLGIQKALHICRGHFAHYTEDRPLFGRSGSAGDYWIPDHVRGKRGRGETRSDYRITGTPS